MISNYMYEKMLLTYFDEYYGYGGYALVNEIYEDEDHRANTWMWGKADGDYIIDVRLVEGLSSNSYAPWEEVQSHFKNMIDQINSTDI